MTDPEVARCGHDHLDESCTSRTTFDKPRIGCGQEWPVGCMFRCVDCGMLLCRRCMKSHCAKDRSLVLTYLGLIEGARKRHPQVAAADLLDWTRHVAGVAIKDLTTGQPSNPPRPPEGA